MMSRRRNRNRAGPKPSEPSRAEHTTAGWTSQGTGDKAEAFVAAELTGRDFLVGPLEPDPGEDFWVECQGRRAIAEGMFPLRALLQVKGSAAIQGAAFADDVPLKQITRWAAQPLPVFLIGVTTTRPPAFYAKSVDDIVVEDLKERDPTTLVQTTVRVLLPLAADLGAVLTKAIHEHHRSMQLVLADVSETDIEQHYFEVLQKPGAWAPTVSWTVLWKSARRPQHFAAMLTELLRRARADYERAVLSPALVIFHVYRSLYDVQHNLAEARVDWVNPGHPKSEAITKVLGAAFKVRHDRDSDALREIVRSQTVGEREFATFASQVGTAFDRITDDILAGPGGVQAWDDALRRQFDEADRSWNEGPFPPVQYGPLDELLRKYNDALLAHNVVALYRSLKLAPQETTRLLQGYEARLRDCRGAWRVFMPTSL